MLIERMSNDLSLPEPYLIGTMLRAECKYKTYSIKKKNGGERMVSQPAKPVKLLQKWVVKHIFSNFPVHFRSMAYGNGCSIRKNAASHQGASFLLSLDFMDFFPSIQSHDLSRFLLDRQKYWPFDLPEFEIDLISKLCCKSGGLVIGAPASPFISNAIMYSFDDMAQKICEANNCIYTRYADDISISSVEPFSLQEVEKKISALVKSLEYPKLKLNQSKRANLSKNQRMKVTGLILTPQGDISIGRRKKREIRTQVFLCLHGKLSLEDKYRLVGYLNFVNSVEPDFIHRLNKKFGAENIEKLRSGS